MKKGSMTMSIERTAHPYIIRDTAIYGGEPIVEGTRTGVRHIILLFQSGKTPKKSPVFIVSPLHRSMTRLVIIMTTRLRLNTLFIMGRRETAQKAHPGVLAKITIKLPEKPC